MVMTIHELVKELEALRVPEDTYSILAGGYPNERLCITNEQAEWQVYYSERGRKSGLKTFSDEEEACEYFYNKLKKYS